MRNSRGQVALALNIVIAIFVVGSLGLVSYEMSRILLAREQLKNCLEMASLAGGVSMASTSQTGATAQSQATTVGLNILKMNAILGTTLDSHVTVCSSVAALNPAPGQTCVYFEFDDPVTKAPAVGAQQGNVLRIYGAYAYPLFSGGFGSIGVNTYTLTAEAMAGMPALDLVIVDNTGSSTDDTTNVTLIRRHWDQTTDNNIIYSIPGGGPGGGGEGTIFGLFCPNLAGSQTNGLGPQNLDAAGDPRTSNCPKEWSETGPLGNTKPLRGLTDNSAPGDAPPSAPPTGGVGMTGLSPGPGNGPTADVALAPAINPDGPRLVASCLNFSRLNSSGANAPLSQIRASAPDETSGKTKMGLSAARWWSCAVKAAERAIVPPAYAHYTDPGIVDYETTNPYGASPTLFTDLVVNLDGNVHFAGYVDPNNPGYVFPSVDYLVEAARGNMENGGVAPNSWISNDLNNVSQPGYQSVYRINAYKNLQPKASVENALLTFVQKVSQTSDCHFSFVAFNDRAGTNSGDFITAPTVSWAYPVAGTTKVAIPHTFLDPNGSGSQAVTKVLTPPSQPADWLPAMMVPSGGCNLADGLTQAYNELTSARSRVGAMKAIVVVTDKVPTRDLAGNKYPDPTANGTALSDAIAVATQCGNQGIPIFMVTIDHENGTMTPFMQEQYSDTASSGLVKTAGHGGALYINNWTDNKTGLASLNGSFNNVVRQLTSIVQEQAKP
ncbi:MAG: hypothetical protein KGS72_23620 [Cyanobacteria bacterium REEB67]|nr:hypothetical protein [Cyanobacteria bacterium REEB67]